MRSSPLINQAIAILKVSGERQKTALRRELNNLSRDKDHYSLMEYKIAPSIAKDRFYGIEAHCRALLKSLCFKNKGFIPSNEDDEWLISNLKSGVYELMIKRYRRIYPGQRKYPSQKDLDMYLEEGLRLVTMLGVISKHRAKSFDIKKPGKKRDAGKRGGALREQDEALKMFLSDVKSLYDRYNIAGPYTGKRGEKKALGCFVQVCMEIVGIVRSHASVLKALGRYRII
ncbi:MAG: hypothetical protein SFW62_00995 [Alphaproteobacteria bacterium]|nr:hypothetical protein [Alphaproteobacteria bacterium]